MRKRTIFEYGSFIIMFTVSLLLIFSCKNKCEEFVPEKILGLNYQEIIDEHGKPNKEIVFELKEDALFEYRYNLVNIIPNYNEICPQIKEVTYKCGKDKVIIWFKKETVNWIAIDVLLWDENVIY